MEYRTLGRSGLKVSTMTIGTMTFGGTGPFAKVGDTDLTGAKRLIDLCLDAGINLLDTANVYSMGISEEIIGEALGGKRPKDLLIASKARMRIGDGPNDEGLSRYHLIRECEKSLKRLRTDVIDLYFMHQWDGQTPLEETLGALDTLVQQGKIRYAGCSNYSAWHIMKALGIAERDGLPRFITQQIHYTLEARGVSGAQVALAWLLGRPGVATLVIGGRNEAQFRDNIAAADLKLTDEERAKLDAVSKPPLLYPYWHQALTVKGRLNEADLVLDRSNPLGNG